MPTATGQPVDGPRPRGDGSAPAFGEADPFGWALLRDSFGYALRAPARHPWLGGGVFAAVVALALLAGAVLPQRYRVQAVVLAQRSALIGTLANPVLNRDWDLPTRAAREVVVRRENLLAIAREVNLVERYLAQRAPALRARDAAVRALSRKERDRGALLESLVDTLQSRLWITATPADTVVVTFEWTSPDVALDVTEAALRFFLRERRATEIDAVAAATEVLERHDEEVKRRITAAIGAVEGKLRALRIRIGPAPLSFGHGPFARRDEPGRLETSLASRRRALDELEGSRERRLTELRAQLTEQQIVFAPSHPILPITRREITALSQPSPEALALRAETEQLEAELHGRGRLGDLASFLESEAAIELMTADPRLAVERRHLDDLLREHSVLLRRIEASRVERDAAEAAFKHRYQVVQPPRPPKGPATPFAVAWVLGGVLGGLALAFFATVAADVWSGRVMERWQVEHALHLTVMGGLGR